jgi:DNA-binding phage protein
MLSGHGNPRVHSLENVLHVFGLRLAVMPERLKAA